MNTKGFSVIIPAAGVGARLGSEIPKAYALLAGRALLRHTVASVLALDGLEDIRIVIHPDHRTLYDHAMAGLDLPPPVPGGSNRQDSVARGLAAFSHKSEDDYVLVHDAARPFLCAESVARLVAELGTHPAASLAVPLWDAVRSHAGETLDRATLHAVQTPQGFHFGVLRQAHEVVRATGENTGEIDDAGLVARWGVPVHYVAGARMNFKITTREDRDMAERILDQAMEIRTGSGFDVHAFAPEADSRGIVRLCGVDIPHERSLAGHSDADVALHALTDAILGALAEGDIGTHFPPSDARWAGADSAQFLTHAQDLARARGGSITHVDITLICESPKITPHRTMMRARMADILGLPESRISLKATTTEGLGFTGRREGIAAQAVATLKVPAQEQKSGTQARHD